MKFERLPLAEAAGHVLGHNVADATGRRALRKGKALTAKDVAVLAELGRRTVYVARLEDGDVTENDAAERIATAVAGDGVRRSRASTGRLNFYAERLGLLRVDPERLLRLNVLDGLGLGLLPADTPVAEGKMVGTLKVIPYALPESRVRRAEDLAAEEPLFHVEALPRRRAGLVLSGSPGAREQLEHGFALALKSRLEALGSSLETVDFVALDDEEGEERLAAAIARRLDEDKLDLLILAGETAIMDRHDIAPRAIERAGGDVECFGAPVDPGNLLLVAYRRRVPIVGAPGCARSPKKNIVDLVLPRLLAGDRLSVIDVAAWGSGGLLEDVPERPQPRSWLT